MTKRLHPLTASLFIVSAIFWFWMCRTIVLWLALRMTYGADRVEREGLTVTRYLRHTVLISNGDQWDRGRTHLIGFVQIGGTFALTLATTYGAVALWSIVRRRSITTSTAGSSGRPTS
jgi:hypothetical protein